MQFKHWLIAEGHRELAQAYRNLLQDVPQDPIHHPEGNALVHIQLVRKAIPRAIEELNKLKQVPPFNEILADIDFNVTPEEFQILFLSAWLHDIGKASATTNIDGKISSIGHETPKFYAPEMKKLKDLASPELINLYRNNAKLINFLIMRHMDLMGNNGFPSNVINSHFKNGRIINSEAMKLLLILMWADKMGRRPEETILTAIGKNAEKLALSSQRSIKRDANIAKANANKPFQGTASDMNAMLKLRNLDRASRLKAIKNKFPNLTPEELDQLTSESYFDTTEKRISETPVMQRLINQGFVAPVADAQPVTSKPIPAVSLTAGWNAPAQAKPAQKMPIPTVAQKWSYRREGD